MTDLFTVIWTEYLRWELLPAYLVTVVLWVLTSSVRGVAWSLVTQVWLVVSLNSSMSVNFVTRYQEVLRDPELGQLSGTAYAFALWNAFFAVPVQVLEEGETEYGQYGLMLRSWWTALLVTFGEYLPDLSVRSGYSYLAYTRATWEAWATVWQRLVAVVKGVCWFVLFILSLVIHVPMALFDLLEFVTFGTTGLGVVLLLVNLLNLLLEWTTWLPTATGVTVVVGIVTHGWRFGSGSGHLDRAAPRVVVKKALKSVRREVNRCNRREAACLASLQGPESAPEDTGPYQETTPLRRSSRIRARRLTPELNLAQVPRVTPDRVTATRPSGPTLRSTATVQRMSDRPCSHEIDIENITLSEEVLRVVKRLRDMEHDRVDRGRSTLGRGVCPVPGNTSGEPEESVVYHAPRPYNVSRRLSECFDNSLA